MARAHEYAVRKSVPPGHGVHGSHDAASPDVDRQPPASGGTMYRQALLAALLLTGAAEPRSTGQIEGAVRDSGGAPVANAQVIVVSRPWTAMSDSTGHYRLADIPAGRYTVRVSAMGYGSQEVAGVKVTAG